jgi:hypothetical protein
MWGGGKGWGGGWKVSCVVIFSLLIWFLSLSLPPSPFHPTPLSSTISQIRAKECL